MSGGDFGDGGTTVEYDNGDVIVDTGGAAAEQIGGSEYAPPEPASNDNVTTEPAANDNTSPEYFNF